MARRFIDGIVVESTEQIGIDIEDALYSDDSGTSETFSQEEYASAMKEYETAQLIKTLALMEQFKALVRLAEEQANFAREAELNYSGVEQNRIAQLRQARISTKFTFDFMRNTVESAASVQRPVLVRD